jgi:hypothetical protein
LWARVCRSRPPEGKQGGSPLLPRRVGTLTPLLLLLLLLARSLDFPDKVGRLSRPGGLSFQGPPSLPALGQFSGKCVRSAIGRRANERQLPEAPRLTIPATPTGLGKLSPGPSQTGGVDRQSSRNQHHMVPGQQSDPSSSRFDQTQSVLMRNNSDLRVLHRQIVCQFRGMVGRGIVDNEQFEPGG